MQGCFVSSPRPRWRRRRKLWGIANLICRPNLTTQAQMRGGIKSVIWMVLDSDAPLISRNFTPSLLQCSHSAHDIELSSDMQSLESSINVFIPQAHLAVYLEYG